MINVHTHTHTHEERVFIRCGRRWNTRLSLQSLTVNHLRNMFEHLSEPLRDLLLRDWVSDVRRDVSFLCQDISFMNQEIIFSGFSLSFFLHSLIDAFDMTDSRGRRQSQTAEITHYVSTVYWKGRQTNSARHRCLESQDSGMRRTLLWNLTLPSLTFQFDVAFFLSFLYSCWMQFLSHFYFALSIHFMSFWSQSVLIEQTDGFVEKTLHTLKCYMHTPSLNHKEKSMTTTRRRIFFKVIQVKERHT